jgi:hypothetical protein
MNARTTTNPSFDAGNPQRSVRWSELISRNLPDSDELAVPTDSRGISR